MLDVCYLGDIMYGACETIPHSKPPRRGPGPVLDLTSLSRSWDTTVPPAGMLIPYPRTRCGLETAADRISLTCVPVVVDDGVQPSLPDRATADASVPLAVPCERSEVTTGKSWGSPAIVGPQAGSTPQVVGAWEEPAILPLSSSPRTHAAAADAVTRARECGRTCTPSPSTWCAAFSTEPVDFAARQLKTGSPSPSWPADMTTRAATYKALRAAVACPPGP
jgi:hypothetical protein